MTFQLGFGFLISLCIVLVSMPSLIRYLKKLSLRQSVSEYALEDDQKKAGTPIMGGLLFIIVPIIVTIATKFSVLHDTDTMIVLLAFAGYGLIGFIDDYLIAVKKNNDGLLPKQKFLMQLVLAVVFFLIYRSYAPLEIPIPFTGREIHTGWLYAVLILFMFTGASNAVNLTDGMDGLAAGCSFIALIPFGIFAYLQERSGLCIFIVSLMGALLGYLYYNKKPAKIFMGDTGSLALGGVLAALAMVMKKELALIFVGGIFVVETLCVIIQLTSVKLRHKRVFPYTPIHYAFRLKGMPEVNIVRMFWLVEAVFALIGLWIGLH
ncbi:MAG: phospho-N-acetylmuramoyl-pentapeptide-transferase [Solobacterium sp.]|nr:phospho-N-acetylmuramoyl-pentapeptide-transferase [Solobacterium sp.]